MDSKELTELKQELAEFRKAVNLQLDNMQVRLEQHLISPDRPADADTHMSSLLQSTSQATVATTESTGESTTTSETSEALPAKANSNQSHQVQDLQREERQSKQQVVPNQTVETSTLHAKPSPDKPSNARKKPQSNNKASQPSGLARYPQIQAILVALFTTLWSWFEPVHILYDSYKKRGMGHVFLLTVGGIGLTLAGVGYLMQLLIEQLQAGSKSLLFSGIAVSVVFAGVKMHSTSRFKEFSVALVALGLLMMYSTVYFSGNVYHILEPRFTLLAYLLTACACHYLAHRLDIKIIYSLGIIGIALLPMLSGKDQHDSLWYLIAVCLVGLGALWFAQKQKLNWLLGLTLSGVFIASEWVGLQNSSTLLLISTFYLLLIWILSQVVAKGEIKTAALLLAAYVGSWLTLLYQSHLLVSASILTLSTVSHGVLCAYVALQFYRRQHNKLSQSVFTVMATLWFCVTAVNLLGQAHWGLAWLIEGMLLMYLASRLEMKHAFITAQGLIAAAIIYNFAAMLPWLPFPALHTVNGWTMCLSISVGLAYWVRLLKKSKFDNSWVTGLVSGLYLLEAGWFSYVLLVCSYFELSDWLVPVVFALQVALLFWSRYLREQAIEWLALGLSLITVSLAIQAFEVAGSFYITDISLAGKVATVTLFLQMWLWAEFYRRYYIEGKLHWCSEQVRLLFYLLLPVCWWSTAYRLTGSGALCFAAFSPLISLTVFLCVRHTVLLKQTQVLTVLAGVGLLLAAVFNWWYGLVGLSVLLVKATIVWWCKYRRGIKVAAPFLLTSVILFSGFIIPLSFGVWQMSLLLPLTLGSCYWLFVYSNPFRYKSLRLLRPMSVLVNKTFLVLSLLTVVDEPWLVLVPLTYLVAGIRLNAQPLISFTQIKLPTLVQNHLIFFASYSTLLLGVKFTYAMLLLGPLMALQGVFMVLRYRSQRYESHVKANQLGLGFLILGVLKVLLLDINASELWQKVLLLVGIGVLLLLASWFYQKLVPVDKDDTSSGAECGR